MNKITKIIFLIVGVIVPIFIGGLHTYVHFRDLLTPEIFEHLQKEVVISGKKQAIWYSWGLISFMMGISFIAIGLINLSIFLKTTKEETLPLLAIIAMLFYQFCVIYVGHEFNQAFQYYGGIGGLMLMSLCFIFTLKQKI